MMKKTVLALIIISDGTREFEISCFKDDNQWAVDFYCKYL